MWNPKTAMSCKGPPPDPYQLHLYFSLTCASSVFATNSIKITCTLFNKSSAVKFSAFLSFHDLI